MVRDVPFAFLPFTPQNMASTSTDGLGSESSLSSAASEAMDKITSTTTFDLFSDLQKSVESAQDPILPKLPSFSQPTVNRKRTRHEYLYSSSDEPVFSSDDLLASSAENYYGPRVKRQIHGSWFELDESGHRVLTFPFKKDRLRGPFKRTYDSGVWLGSDESMESEENDQQDAVRKTLRVMEKGGSIDGEDELWHEDERELDLGDNNDESTQTLEDKLQQALVNKSLQLTEDPGGFEGPVFPYWQEQPAHLMGFHSVQKQAQAKVASCVEEGGEVVDLSYVCFLGCNALDAWLSNAVQAFLDWIGFYTCVSLNYERLLRDAIYLIVLLKPCNEAALG